MTSFAVKEQFSENQDLMDQAISIVFYEKAPDKRAYDFLVWREKITDPAHALNKSPLLTLMVLDTWLACDDNNQNTPEAKHWTRQLLDACGLWAWPLNSSATELY